MPSRSLPFRYEVSVSGITTTVTCHGSLLSDNVDELKQLVKPMIPICRHIVIGLSNVNLVDSAGLGATRVTESVGNICGVLLARVHQFLAAVERTAAHHETKSVVFVELSRLGLSSLGVNREHAPAVDPRSRLAEQLQRIRPLGPHQIPSGSSDVQVREIVEAETCVQDAGRGGESLAYP